MTDYRHVETGQVTTQPDGLDWYFLSRGYVVVDLAAEAQAAADAAAALAAAESAAAAEAPSLVEGTVDDVLAAVAGDPVKAAAALEAERAGRGRVTLLAALEDIANPGEVVDGADDAQAEGLDPRE